MIKVRVAVVLATSIVIVACSDVPSPDEDTVVGDLQSLDEQLIKKKKPALFADADIVDIEHVGGESVAVATVRIPSQDPDPESEYTEIRLILKHTDTGWEIYDKDLENPGSSTSMILRGN